jgi:hypothetical protein
MSATCARMPMASPRPVPRSPRATRTCPAAPKNRPARWSRPPPRWRSSAPPSAECRQRPPGQPAGADASAWPPRRRGGGPGGRHHEGHQRQLAQDRRHHLGDRRHRLPDQHPGAECRRRGGPCRRAGPRFRGRRLRSAQPGRALSRSSQGDQGADLRQRAARRQGLRAGGPGRRHDDRGGGAIRRVTDIMGEISAASTEQSAGVAQVGEAVTQMDQATQQNAALVEESAAAADSLKQQAQQLVQAVAVFKAAPESGQNRCLPSRLHARPHRRSNGAARTVPRMSAGRCSERSPGQGAGQGLAPALRRPAANRRRPRAPTTGPRF